MLSSSQKSCSNVCTEIILLEISSEGLFIQLKKVFCSWILLICPRKQQCPAFMTNYLSPKWATENTILYYWA